MSKVVAPVSLRDAPVELLGVLFHWDSLSREFIVSVAPPKVMALIKATVHVLTVGAATGTEIASLVGSWAWSLLLRRPAFVTLQHVYRFSLVPHRRRFVVWPSVQKELLRLMCMAPLLRTSLTAGFCTRFVASDASSTGGGVVATDLTPRLISTFWPMHFSHQLVAGSFSPVEPSAGADPESQQPCLDATPQWTASHSPYQALEQVRWSTIVSTQWKFAEHINALELRALLITLQWIVSLPRTCSTRLFALLDSAVAFYAIRKGRSSSPGLLPLIRKINVLLLAGHITLLPIWVPSAANPTDAPSRL
jgi:hypothetical protein